MSSFWSGFVIVLAVANTLGCVWLIYWASKKRGDEAKTGDVTGHTWDDNLQEFNNPLPRWWLYLFYITIVFSLIYFALYPAIGNIKGYFNWSSEDQYNKEIEAANAKYGPLFAKYASQPIAELAKDTKATQIGQRLFINYCATCHGSDAKGASGFPNLADKDWLYSGTGEEIKKSILLGRTGVMPDFGKRLGDKSVEDLTHYVMSINASKSYASQVDQAKAQAGQALFATECAVCHQANATGNPLFGAPNLTDNIWLYGGSAGVIQKTIANGRMGQMPPHKEFLGEDKAHLLAAYIYSLSN